MTSKDSNALQCSAGYFIVTIAYNEEVTIGQMLQSNLDSTDHRLQILNLVANDCTGSTLNDANKTLAQTCQGCAKKTYHYG